MKTICCFSAFLFSSVQFSLATVRTLSNTAFSPGEYTTFDAAQAACLSGNTIYVHGSNINYGDIVIYQSLVIIGTGHNPNKQSPRVSSFRNISVQAGGVQLIGLTFNTLDNSGYHDGTVKKCRILGSTQNSSVCLYLSGSAHNWLIEGNIFDQSDDTGIYFGGGQAPNTIIENNIFANQVEKINGLNNDPSQTTYILNNVFLSDAPGAFSFVSVNYAVVNNNVFYASSPVGHSGALFNSSMNNNISFQCSDDSFLPGLNNLAGVDPLFVNYPGLPSLFSYNFDFNLSATSPGHNTGTDGTDRGVWGGIGSLFSMTGEPSIAEITAFTITSPTVVPPGGTLNISITSKRAH